jgi:hypothetical protein
MHPLMGLASMFTTPGVGDFVSTAGLVVALSVYLGAVRQSMLKSLPADKTRRKKRLLYLSALVVPEALLVLAGLQFTWIFVIHNVRAGNAPQWEKTSFMAFGVAIAILALFHAAEWVQTLVKLTQGPSENVAAGATDKLVEATKKNLEAAKALEESAKMLHEVITTLKQEELEIKPVIDKL